MCMCALFNCMNRDMEISCDNIFERSVVDALEFLDHDTVELLTGIPKEFVDLFYDCYGCIRIRE